MSDLSNAEVSGGIVFELKGDPAPLRATMKQETSQKHEVVVTLKTNTSAIASAKNQIIELYEAAREPYELKIDAKPIHQFGRDFRRFLAELRVDAEREGEQIGSAISKGMSRGGSGGGGGGGGHGNIGRKNLLSQRGLETLGLGGSATAAFAIIEATRLAGELIEAQQIAAHPERIARTFQSVGGWAAADDPYIMAKSGELAKIQKRMKETDAMESIPIIGNLTRIANSAFDVRGRDEDKEFQVKKGIEEQQWIHQTKISDAVRSASLTDDAIGMHKIQGEEELRIRENNQVSAYGELLGKARDEAKIGEGGWAKGNLAMGTDEGREKYLQIARENNPEVAAKLDEANSLVETLKKLNAAEEDQLKRVKDSAITRLQGSIIGAGFDLRATGATTGFSIGGARTAMELQQAGALGRFDKDTEATLGTIKDPALKEQTRISKAAERAKVEADQTKQSTDFQIQENARIAKNETEINQNTIHNNAAINATKLQGDRQFFEAKKQAARDASAAELQAAQSANNAEFKNLVFSQHAGPAEIVSAVRRMASGIQSIQLRGALNQQGLDTEEGYRVTQSVLDSAASSQSSVLKAGGFNWEAHIASRNREQYKALGQIENKDEWTAKLADFRANNAMEEKGHKFELEDRKIARDADLAAAEDRQKDLPISAQIEQAAAAARLAIRNADPGEREEVRKTEMAKFKATEHELLGVHGGGYAAKGTAFFTPGDPLGLGKGAQDRENAAKVAADKEKEITNQQGKDIGDISKWLTDTFWNAFSTLCSQLPGGLIGNGD